MTQRGRATRRRPRGGITGLVFPALLLCAVSSAQAQTGSPAEGGPLEPVIEKAEPPQAPAQPAEPKPDGFTVGGFVFKPGGRIKLDVIRDFKPIGSEDSFDPRTIPIDAGDGVNSQLHARETRLSLDVRGPVEGRELRMFVETDFYGSGNALRLRHAYGSWGGLLAGQTWSVFVDDANFPNTIDFESPLAFPQIRQAQVRYSQKLNETVSWAAGVEDNKSAIESPTGESGEAEYPMPDLTGHIRFGAAGGHGFVSGFVGKGRFRPTVGEPDDVTLWGMLFSGRAKFGRDALYGQFTVGDGVGRYRGGITAVPDANGELAPVGLWAVMGGYEHYWSAVLSTNAVYAVTSARDEDYYADDFNHELRYGAVNLLYWFLPNRAWLGVEYLYGRREVFDGGIGRADRVQFAVRFNLP